MVEPCGRFGRPAHLVWTVLPPRRGPTIQPRAERSAALGIQAVILWSPERAQQSPCSTRPPVSPFQGSFNLRLWPQGGAALCPGLPCFGPSGQLVKQQGRETHLHSCTTLRVVIDLPTTGRPLDPFATSQCGFSGLMPAARRPRILFGTVHCPQCRTVATRRDGLYDGRRCVVA